MNDNAKIVMYFFQNIDNGGYSLLKEPFNKQYDMISIKSKENMAYIRFLIGKNDDTREVE